VILELLLGQNLYRVCLLITVPSRGVRLTPTSNPSSNFTVSGLVKICTRLYNLTTAPLPRPIPVTELIDVVDSRLTTDSVTGISPLVTVVGLAGTYSGTYTLSRAVTVSG